MKIYYLTGAALAVVAFAAVQSHAETTPPAVPPPPVAAQPADQVCDVEATVNGVTTKYHYVVRKREVTDADTLPPPPEGAPGGTHIERRDVFMYGNGDHEGHGGPMHMFHMMDMAQLDADKDGKVSFTEFTAPMQDMFNHLDANHDGSLSADELPKGPPGGPQSGPMGGPPMGPGTRGMPPGDLPPPPLPPECAP